MTPGFGYAPAMRAVQLIGLLLWRGGLLFIGAAILFYAARFLLRFISVPVQLEVGLGLMVAGFCLVMISLITERIADARTEEDLRE